MVMKECRYCKKSYPESFFGVALTTKEKVYRRHKCKYCYQKAKNELRHRHGKFISEYKSKNGCEICGLSDSRVLEFHHRDPKSKEFTIAIAYYNRVGIDKIMEEIKKCAILCANCHRVTHYEENGW